MYIEVEDLLASTVYSPYIYIYIHTYMFRTPNHLLMAFIFRTNVFFFLLFLNKPWRQK